MMGPALVEHSGTKTSEIASGIFQGKDFQCITNILKDIGFKNPKIFKRRF